MSGFPMAFPGPQPGVAKVKAKGSQLKLENDLLSVHWDLAKGLRLVEATDKPRNKTWAAGPSECLQIIYFESPSPDRRILTGAQMHLIGQPIVQNAPVSQVSKRQSQQYAGKQIIVNLAAPDRSLTVQWRASLRNEANYVRQTVELQAGADWVELHEIILLDVEAKKAVVQGSVDGSPAVAGRWFMGLEHPMSKSEVIESSSASAKGAKRVRCSYPFAPPLAPGQRQQYSTVLGLAPKGQLRRGFLYYLERERAQPYRQFLHTSTGEDMGAYYSELRDKDPAEFKKFCLNQEKWWRSYIEDFGQELVVKRNVVMDCFAHDHMWDDPETPWQFYPDRYPEGFAKARLLAEQYGAILGIWFSPDAVTGARERVTAGIKQKFEGFRVGDSDEGMTLALLLSGRRYFGRLRAAAVNMLRRQGVGYYKFDGIADGYNFDYKPSGAGQWSSDYEALLELYTELRALKPDVFINSSTGCWPSPFLLRWADCIWHQGADVGLYGPEFKGWSKGTPRQRWITYRDSATYHNGLVRGPLFPLNSYMLHGLEYNLTSRGPDFGRERVRGLETDDLLDEIHSYFGTGTNLQELFLTPSLMTEQTWDVVAEVANWSRANADVLVDTHWVGGDPAQDEVYGWASWTPRKGILTLRNPDDQARTINLDIAQVFELPQGAPENYRLKSPWQDRARQPEIEVAAGRHHKFQLEPFEVLVFDAEPYS